MKANWTLVLIVLVMALAAGAFGVGVVAVDRLVEHAERPSSAVDIVIRGRAAEEGSGGGVWFAAFAVLAGGGAAVWRLLHLRFKADMLKQQRLAQRRPAQARRLPSPQLPSPMSQVPWISRQPAGPALPAPDGGEEGYDNPH